MRLNLYWRGYDLLDIELHALRRRIDDDEMVVVSNSVADTERSEDDPEPDTWVFGFCK